MRRVVVSCLALWLSSSVQLAAQKTNRYVIRFADKVGTPYSIKEPQKFLSTRSLSRREKHSIAVTEEDLPVSSLYLEALRALGLQVYFTSRWINAALVQMSSERVAEIEHLPYVSSVVLAAPGKRLETDPSTAPTPLLHSPTDTLNSSKRPLNYWQNAMLGIPEMHKMRLQGEGILVALMDGGFRDVDSSAYFYDLHKEKRVIDTYDFVSNLATTYHKGTHGSSVLSVMAAYQAGSFVGIAPKAQYALYTTEDGDTEYRIEEYNWLFAAERADSLGVDIIQTSLGYRDFDVDTMNYTSEQLDGQHALISRAATMAQKRGILVVVAVGNLGEKGLSAPADPAAVVSVGAVDFRNNWVSFSSVGKEETYIKPDVVAMGHYTVCLSPTEVVEVSGTSLAAPLISALAAGLWQAFPTKRNYEIAALLRTSADQANKPDKYKGYGMPYFPHAASIASTEIACKTQSNIRRIPPLLSDTLLQLRLPEAKTSQIEARLLDTQGNLLKKRPQLKQKADKLLLNFSDIARGLYLLQLRSVATPTQCTASLLLLE